MENGILSEKLENGMFKKLHTKAICKDCEFCSKYTLSYRKKSQQKT
jgi:hypothetical protein